MTRSSNLLCHHITANCANKGLQNTVIDKIKGIIHEDKKPTEPIVLTVQEGGFSEIRAQLDTLCKASNGYGYRVECMRTRTKNSEMFHKSGLMNIVIAPEAVLGGDINLSKPDPNTYPQCTVNSTIPGELRGAEFWSALCKNKSLTRWNKGGLVSVLTLGERKILLKNVHLDSKGVDCRHQDFLAVVNYGPRIGESYEDDSEKLNTLLKRLDTLIVGDYNTRNVLFRDDTVFGRRQSTTSINSMDGIANSLSTATSKQLVTALMGVSVGEERDDAPSISTVSDIDFNQSDDESDVFDGTLLGRPQSRSTYLPNGGRKSPFEADEKRPGFTIGGELDRFGSNGSIKLNNPVKELSCNSQLDDGHDHVPRYATYQAPSLVGEQVKKEFVRKTLNNMLNTFKTCKTCVSDSSVHELAPSCSIDHMVSLFNVYFAADGKCEIAMHIRISRIKSQPQPQQNNSLKQPPLSDERNVVGYLSTMNTNMSREENDKALAESLLGNRESGSVGESPVRAASATHKTKAAYCCLCLSWLLKRLLCCFSFSSSSKSDKDNTANNRYDR